MKFIFSVFLLFLLCVQSAFASGTIKDKTCELQMLDGVYIIGTEGHKLRSQPFSGSAFQALIDKGYKLIIRETKIDENNHFSASPVKEGTLYLHNDGDTRSIFSECSHSIYKFNSSVRVKQLGVVQVLGAAGIIKDEETCELISIAQVFSQLPYCEVYP